MNGQMSARCHLVSMMVITTLFCLIVTTLAVFAADTPPNVIFIIGDDLGWNDVSYHGANQIPTPNIDALCHSGVCFHNYYVTPMCSPSRVALNTGLYPIDTGDSSIVFFAAEKRGLNLSYTLLPQRLKNLGYSTHLVGKWHLGHYTKEYTPTYRGFDSALGPWTGHIDYYEHTALERNPDPNANQSIKWLGFDFRRNMEIERNLTGQYATNIFTNEALRIIKEHDKAKPLFLEMTYTAPHAGNVWNPLQAPYSVIDSFAHIKDTRRQKYAAMVSELDSGVGDIMEALAERDLLENSIIVFSTDNGGTNAPSEGDDGSNYPLRGIKNTMYEGGVRGVGMIWSSLLKQQGWVNHELFHITDWLPTLYTAAGGDVADLGDIRGRSQWESLQTKSKSPRENVLLNIDSIQNIAAYREGDWKIIDGGSFMDGTDGWYGNTGRDAFYVYDSTLILNSKTAKALGKFGNVVKDKETIKQLRKETTVNCINWNNKNGTTCRPCLFNLSLDPCETTNVAALFPSVTKRLQAKLDEFRANAHPPNNQQWDLCGYPGNWDDTWVNFGDFTCPDVQPNTA